MAQGITLCLFSTLNVGTFRVDHQLHTWHLQLGDGGRHAVHVLQPGNLSVQSRGPSSFNGCLFLDSLNRGLVVDRVLQPNSLTLTNITMVNTLGHGLVLQQVVLLIDMWLYAHDETHRNENDRQDTTGRCWSHYWCRDWPCLAPIQPPCWAPAMPGPRGCLCSVVLGGSRGCWRLAMQGRGCGRSCSQTPHRQVCIQCNWCRSTTHVMLHSVAGQRPQDLSAAAPRGLAGQRHDAGQWPRAVGAPRP